MQKNLWLLIIVFIVLGGAIAWQIKEAQAPLLPVVTNFEECVAAGNPVMESYPRQCRSAEGELFVEEIKPTDGGATGGGAGILPHDSGVSGWVLLGPTCPVVQDPPEPECADKPYSTLVAIFRKTDPVHAIILTESDKEGRFSASLPPGDYIVGAGESALPSCAQQEFTILPSQTIELTISCDSGIR